MMRLPHFNLVVANIANLEVCSARQRLSALVALDLRLVILFRLCPRIRTGMSRHHACRQTVLDNAYSSNYSLPRTLDPSLGSKSFTTAQGVSNCAGFELG